MDEIAQNIMLSFSNSAPSQSAPAALIEQASPTTTSTASPIEQANPSQASAPSAGTAGSSVLKMNVNWTEEMCLMLCREVDFINPFKHKQRTKESSKAWEDITSNLKKHGLNVTKRAVRDKYYKLKENVMKKNKTEEKSSGIAPEHNDTEAELTQIIEELTEVENDSKELLTQKQQQEEKKQLDGVEMRKRALESFTETNKRTNSEKGARKRRNTGSDTTEYLMKKLEMERDLKDRELQLRREEMESKRQEEQRKLEREEREEERRRQDDERRREREEREEERRRRDEERRKEKEEREEERKKREEERRIREDEERDRRMDLLQQQLLQQNAVIMTLLKNQNRE
ncbi:uncharacterized protein [Diadema setosum]|uniref:uncharacterized protein n=2 Tax=Diadema setosum TaxID=31175 RepID=UPI003B3A6269